MTAPSSGFKAYNLVKFSLLSVLAGLLVAGMLLPPTLVAGTITRHGAESLNSLPAELEIGQQSERSKVLMADGSTLVEFFAENRTYVPLDKIAKVMQQAQIDIEDSRFYEHGAIDAKGIMRAAVRTASGTTQGASTLTQQYVKLVQVEAATVAGDTRAQEAAVEQTMTRKIRELRYAAAVEKKYSKDQILERYLNIAYFGDHAYGVEAAARHYFATTADKLTLPQAAMLAGIVQNPNNLNPVSNLTASIQRRNVVLSRMQELGTITKEQAEAAKKVAFDPSKVTIARGGCIASEFPSLCNYIERTLKSDAFPSLGKTPEQRDNTLRRGGLVIQTQIDPKAQRAAQAAVSSRIAPTDPFISTMTMIQPKTGLIVAMAQNRPKIGTGPGESWFTYAAEQKYGGAEGFQAGSTFKPFTMAAALDKGMSVQTRFDSPARRDFSGEAFRTCTGTVRHRDYAPKNAGTRNYGLIDMRQAAMSSVNTYFVALEQAVGICDTVKMTQLLGVKMGNGQDMIKDAKLDSVASFTLGPVEVAPMTMAEAYATFANRGIHCDPNIIQSITTKDGKKKLAVPAGNCKQVIKPAVADAVNDILQDVVSHGTGTNARLFNGHSIAGKTGTTDGSEAVWFAGYTPELAGVAMIAADKLAPEYRGRKTRSIAHRLSHGTECGSGCYIDGSGGSDAAEIWKPAMRSGLEGLPKTKFSSPNSDQLKGEKKEIPSGLSEMNLSEAKQAITDAGLTYVLVEMSSNYTPKGSYMYASPRSGSRFPGDPIRLYISSGKSAPVPATKAPQAPKSSATATPKPATSATATPAPATKPATKPSKGKKP